MSIIAFGALFRGFGQFLYVALGSRCAVAQEPESRSGGSFHGEESRDSHCAQSNATDGLSSGCVMCASLLGGWLEHTFFECYGPSSVLHSIQTIKFYF